jgi:hypothetical protein
LLFAAIDLLLRAALKGRSEAKGGSVACIATKSGAQFPVWVIRDRSARF